MNNQCAFLGNLVAQMTHTSSKKLQTLWKWLPNFIIKHIMYCGPLSLSSFKILDFPYYKHSLHVGGIRVMWGWFGIPISSNKKFILLPPPHDVNSRPNFLTLLCYYEINKETLPFLFAYSMITFFEPIQLTNYKYRGFQWWLLVFLSWFKDPEASFFFHRSSAPFFLSRK